LFISQTAYAQISELKITASDNAAGNFFGESVSISGDYSVVGSHRDDDNGDASGSAYVFKRSGTSWTQEAKLLPSDGATNDLFGSSVSISGDYAVVGAWRDDDNGSLSGSAYLFKRIGTSWAQEAKLLPSDGAAGDYFGWSVSISGDYAVVGATFDGDNGSASGSAYVFKRSGTSWVEEAKLLASDGAARDWFGWSVSISGDYAVVGARFDDDNGDASGSAYLFKRTEPFWAQEAKLLSSDITAGDHFGWSVSVSGDYAVVGAFGDDDNGSASGSAYVYNGFASPVEVEGVSVSLPYAVPGIDSVVVTAAVGGPADISLFAEIESPDGVPLDTIPLFDDGAHHDGEAGDSLFGNAWLVPPDEERLYFVDLQVTYVDTDTVTVSFEFNNRGLFTTIGPIVYDGQDSIFFDGNRYFFTVTLANNGLVTTASDISAKMSTSDTCVTSFSSAGKFYGDITAGGSITPPTSSSFLVVINSSCASTEEQLIPFDMEISSDEFTFWTDSFDLQVPPIVGVEDEIAGLPAEFALSQNYPNPFNPITTIEYSLPITSNVTIDIYNLRGELVTELINEIRQAGTHRLNWDASDLSTGIYFYRLIAGSFHSTRKMVLLK